MKVEAAAGRVDVEGFPAGEEAPRGRDLHRGGIDRRDASMPPRWTWRRDASPIPSP